MDTLTVAERSARMALVKSRHTKPELVVRRLVHGLGFRYRLHASELPGKPDLVFRTRQRIIFVHGCFWHRHRATGCKLARIPKSNVSFWLGKLEGNRRRDLANLSILRKNGWKVLQIWECELNNLHRLARRIERFMQ